MHAVVAGWSSVTFYDGLVQTHPSAASRLLSDKESVEATELTRSPIIGISVAPSARELTLKSGLERRGRGGELTNEAEVAAVVGHAATLIRSGVDPADIVVISPYTAQVALIERALANAAVRQPQLEPLQSDEGSSEEVTSLCGLGQVDVATVDSYQGREAEAVILSLVRSNARRQVGFLADYRRLNVAVTRARRHVALVCDPQTVAADGVIASLLELVASEGAWYPPTPL